MLAPDVAQVRHEDVKNLHTTAHCLSVALGNSALASSTAHFDQAREPLELPAEVVRYTPDEGFAVRFLDLDAGMLPILRVVLVRIKELSEKPD